MIEQERVTDQERIHDEVRARYAEAALAAGHRVTDEAAYASCCGPDGSKTYGQILYTDAELEGMPEAARLASLGCGNPIAIADLKPGERVLDLGSGGGIDVILSARRVGPTGRAIGLDMTDAMLELAQQTAAEAGVANIEFVRGTIESIPLSANSVDVVISNCVINLAADKAAALSEIARVLRPGGRVGVSDVVADDHLSPEERAERGSFVGCIAGALSFSEYREGLAAVGLADVTITATNEVADGLHSAIVRATKPLDTIPLNLRPAMPELPRPLPIAGDGSCACGAEGCC